MAERRLTHGSMFSGIGGFDLGFESCGIETKWQVEIDLYARKVLEKHWPSVPCFKDVCTFPPRWHKHDEDTKRQFYVDIISAGFPCQDLSVAGKGAGLEGERSGLFTEVIRVARLLRPRWIVLENVPALLSRGMGTVLRDLASIGYDAEWHCIQAADFGAPHIRDRIFILAHPNGERLKGIERKESAWETSPTSGPDQPGCNSNSYSRRLPQFAKGDDGQEQKEVHEPRRDDTLRFRDNVPDSDVEGLAKRKGQDAGRPGAQEWCEPERSSWWSSEPNVGRVVDGLPRRVDRIRVLGNAVVPQCARFLGELIKAKA